MTQFEERKHYGLGSKYYSIHGSDKDGYRLMMYRYNGDINKAGKFIEAEDVSPYWSTPKIFKTLAELITALEEEHCVR